MNVVLPKPLLRLRCRLLEQPAQIELWINVNTAKALGIDIPSQLQQLADRVIE